MGGGYVDNNTPSAIRPAGMPVLIRTGVSREGCNTPQVKEEMQSV